LHRTFVYDVPQTTIGVPAWTDPEELTLKKLLAIPFRRQRDDWVRIPSGF